jgi:hypothetical protein
VYNNGLFKNNDGTHIVKKLFLYLCYKNRKGFKRSIVLFSILFDVIS